MSPEYPGLLKFARYRFFIISEAIEFRISFTVTSIADLTFIRFLFESEENIGTDEVIVFIQEGKTFVWQATETSDILPGFPYKVTRIHNASV